MAWPENARSSTSHCLGSVSWNSSTSTIFHRCRIRWRAGASSSAERVGEPAEEVVVGEDPEAPLAPVDLVAHLAGEGDPRPGLGLRTVRPRSSTAASSAWASPTTVRARVSAVARPNGGSSARLPEAAQVDVVDHLDDELVERLDQRRAGVGVARDPERAQHGLAELVGGRDGGGVERRERVAQARGAAARPRRRRRRAGGRSPGGRGRPTPGRPARARPATSCSRTRSRSSWLAARPKVITSSWSSGTPSSAT